MLSPYEISAHAERGQDRRYHAHATLPDARQRGGYLRAEAAADSYPESVHRAVETLLRKAAA